MNKLQVPMSKQKWIHKNRYSKAFIIKIAISFRTVK